MHAFQQAAAPDLDQIDRVRSFADLGVFLVVTIRAIVADRGSFVRGGFCSEHVLSRWKCPVQTKSADEDAGRGQDRGKDSLEAGT